jgi:hypothetical protein
METKEVIHKNDQPLKILLQKIKTGYRWEIHIQGKDIAEILPELRSANAALKREYGGVEIMASTLAELNSRIEEIEPNRLERIGWLVDRLYHELIEQEA